MEKPPTGYVLSLCFWSRVKELGQIFKGWTGVPRTRRGRLTARFYGDTVYIRCGKKPRTVERTLVVVEQWPPGPEIQLLRLLSSAPVHLPAHTRALDTTRTAVHTYARLHSAVLRALHRCCSDGRDSLARELSSNSCGIERETNLRDFIYLFAYVPYAREQPDD